MSAFFGLTELLSKNVYKRSFAKITGETKTAQFEYKTKLVDNLKYRHASYDHNILRHSKPSM